MPPVVFALWTLFVWGTRIRNADGAVGATVLALTFVLLAIGVLAWRARRRQLLLVLALSTVGLWAIRTPIIVFGDRSVAFKVVHAVLAVVSVGLAGWALQHDVKRQREAPAAATRL